ncbi:MAG TPA: DUF58 domain-containing protein [Mycobacteriales bacterium]|nr:DUF58 domain-containing protein [Mycobacteriales bacterium]
MLDRVRLLPRPTRSTSLILLLAALLELLGRLIHSTGVTLAAAAGVGAVIGDWLLTPGAALDSVERHTPARMAVGVETTVQLSVTSRGARIGGRRPVVLIDHAPGLDVGRFVTPALRAGERAVGQRTAMPLRRGCWADGGRVDLEAYSPLGGWVRRSRVRLPETGWVHPAPAPPLRLPDPTSGELYGRGGSSRSGGGVDFYGIREWRAGDARSAIHWRASARRNELVVMERERPGHPTLLVVVAPLGAGDGPESLLARVAATALHALRDGRSVVLLADGPAVTVSRPTDALDWFAAVDPVRPVTTEQLRAGLQAAGGGAIVLWLGAASPEALGIAARGGGAGAVVSAAELATQARR